MKVCDVRISTIRTRGRAIADQCGFKYEQEFHAENAVCVCCWSSQLKYVTCLHTKKCNRSYSLYILGYDPENTYYYPFTEDTIKHCIGNVNPKQIKGRIFCNLCYNFTSRLVYHLERECEYVRYDQCLNCNCTGLTHFAGNFRTSNDCNRWFFNERGFANHLANNICRKYRLCSKGKMKHDCVNIKCQVCYKK